MYLIDSSVLPFPGSESTVKTDAEVDEGSA